MSIDTRIDGHPGSIRTAGTWLESTLANGVFDRTSDVHRARTEVESGWWGKGGESFHTRLSRHARQGDDIAAAAKDVGGGFHRYADELAKAQERMGQARETATAGGLTVTGDQIEAPGPPPEPVAALPPDGSATPQQVRDHIEATQAQQAHARKTVAYLAASKQASEARTIEKGAKNFLDGLYHRYLSGGVGSGLNGLGDLNVLRAFISEAGESVLRTKAAEFTDAAKNALIDVLYHGADTGKGVETGKTLLQEATTLLRKSEQWKTLGLDKEFGKGLSASGGILAALTMADGFAHHGDFGKTIMSGMTGVGIDAGIAALGIEGGPAGLAAAAAYETYQHPVGSGEVAKVLHDLPGDVEDAVLSKAGDYLSTHGHEKLGALVDSVTDVHRTFNHVSGDFLQGAVTIGGHAAQGAVDHASDLLDMDKDVAVDLFHGHFSHAVHDGLDGITKQAGDTVDDAKTLAHDGESTAKHVAGDTAKGAESLWHHATGWL
ncbi:hypothetical protein [Amycolatopsis alkalitolerans]|uniref:Uncharacterized protein n=1 Tax=Amycolatopsis alkalitolerans TaxID=2547244 RepID=A0A5C4M5D7_9PSEU|nr:hypothetical protein [Amycolatopsis alkalitolerans]TNC28454.1 hypothetical protein FG385_04010 [Amycolatopsis alkalitolerans]